MNILLFRTGDWRDDDLVVVEDERAAHMREVLRVGVGDQLRVGALQGLRGTATVIAIDPYKVTLRTKLIDPPPPRHPFDIALALPRPKMLRRILRTVAEYGVENLHLFHSYRVEKSYWQSPLLTPDKIDAALLTGLERAGDTIPPSVHFHKRFKPFIEDELGVLTAGRSCLIAHPGADSLLPHDSGNALLMIGPEGGFIPYEIDLACIHGARTVNLGGRVLSVDTAVNAGLAIAGQ